MDDSSDSMEKALSGDYSLNLGEILEEAWRAIHGYKMTVLLASGLLWLALLGLSLLPVILVGLPDETHDAGIVNLLTTLISFGFLGVYASGIVVMGARISLGEEVAASDAFVDLPRFFKAMGTYLLMSLLISLGLLVFVLPGIYLYVAYFYALPLALDKGLSPWQALEASRKAITHRWFTLFGLTAVTWLLGLVGALTLGIATIWFLPLSLVAYGIVYRDVFGLDPEPTVT